MKTIYKNTVNKVGNSVDEFEIGQFSLEITHQKNLEIIAIH